MVSGSFRESSRYWQQKVLTVTKADGRKVRVVSLRIVPARRSTSMVVTKADRLDKIAHERYRDSKRFWRIADANDELDPTKLIKDELQTLEVPDL